MSSRCLRRNRSCFGLLFGIRSVRDFVASAIYASSEPRICPICACSVTKSSSRSLTVEPYVFHTECFKCAICALRVSPSASPQIRAGGQRVVCRKCVKNGCRPTQPQVRLSVIARDSPRQSIDGGNLRTLGTYESHTSIESVDSSTPLNRAPPSSSHGGFRGRQLVRTDSVDGSKSGRSNALPSPVPSLSGYLEAAEGSLEAAASRQASPKSVLTQKMAHLAEKDIDEDAILGAPLLPAAGKGGTSSILTPVHIDHPHTHSEDTSPRKTKNGSPSASNGHKKSSPSSGHSSSKSSPIRKRRSLDPLFLNPELSLSTDKEDESIHTAHNNTGDVSDGSELSDSYTIDVKSSHRDKSAPPYGHSKSTTSKKAAEYVLDFKQETEAREFEGNDLGIQLRQLEEIGVPGAHLEKIAAALGSASFVSTKADHKRHASEGVLSTFNPPRLYPGGKSPRGDFSGRGSAQLQIGAPGNVSHKRAVSSLSMLNPSIGLASRPPPTLGTVYVPKDETVDPHIQSETVNPCESAPHTQVDALSPPPLGTPNRRPSRSHVALAQPQQQNPPRVSSTNAPHPGVSASSSLH